MKKHKSPIIPVIYDKSQDHSKFNKLPKFIISFS